MIVDLVFSFTFVAALLVWTFVILVRADNRKDRQARLDSIPRLEAELAMMPTIEGVDAHHDPHAATHDCGWKFSDVQRSIGVWHIQHGSPQ